MDRNTNGNHVSSLSVVEKETAGVFRPPKISYLIFYSLRSGLLGVCLFSGLGRGKLFLALDELQ